MPVCRLTPRSRATGVMWRTGSTAHAWVASTQCTSTPSASSTIYLRARASAWASSTWNTAAVQSSAHEAKSATASYSAKSRTAFGRITAVSTPYLSTPQPWTCLTAELWWCGRWCPATPSRCLTMSVRACWGTPQRLTSWTDPMTPTVCASALLRAGAPATQDSSSPPAPAGWRSSSTTIDNTDGPHKLSQISST